MSKAMTEEPYEPLGNAIILQAVKDYRAALRRIKHNPKNRMVLDEALLIEKFFKGKLYAAITNIDGKFLIDKLRKEAA